MKRIRTKCLIFGCLALFLCLNGCTKSTPEEKTPSFDQFVQEGNQAMQEKRWSDAVRVYSQGLAINSNNVDLLYRRATAYLATARDYYTLAEAAVDKNETSEAEEQVKKADDYFSLARKDCDDALSIDSSLADIHYISGCTYIYQGEWQKAIAAFDQCIQYDPQNAFAYQRRGEVFGHIGDTINETVDLKKAAELGYHEE